MALKPFATSSKTTPERAVVAEFEEGSSNIIFFACDTFTIRRAVPFIPLLKAGP